MKSTGRRRLPGDCVRLSIAGYRKFYGPQIFWQTSSEKFLKRKKNLKKICKLFFVFYNFFLKIPKGNFLQNREKNDTKKIAGSFLSDQFLRHDLSLLIDHDHVRGTRDARVEAADDKFCKLPGRPGKRNPRDREIPRGRDQHREPLDLLVFHPHEVNVRSPRGFVDRPP